MVVLEREDRARARGATIYASIDGYGSTCDAYHRVQMAPAGEEIVRAMTLAIERSGRRPEEIGYVNFHGTSTVLNDAVESRCVRQVFGAHADRLAGSSVKSMIGHPQGASGAAGVVTAALAHVARIPAADDQPARRRIPRAISTSSRTTAAPPTSSGALQLPRLRIEEQRARHRTRVARRLQPSDGIHRCLDRRCGAGGLGGRHDPRARRRARADRRSRDVSARQTVRRHGQPRHAGAAARAGARRAGSTRAACASTGCASPARAAWRSKGGIPAGCRAARSRGAISTGCCCSRRSRPAVSSIRRRGPARDRRRGRAARARSAVPSSCDRRSRVADRRARDDRRRRPALDDRLRPRPGASSRRARAAGRSARTSRTSRAGREPADDLGEMHVRRGHYIGVAPVPGGLTNVCLVKPSWPAIRRWPIPPRCW